MNICWIDNKKDENEVIEELIQLKDIAIVNKKFPLISNLSVLENITLVISYHKSKKIELLKDEIVEKLKLFDMQDKIHFRENDLTPFENFVTRFLQATFSGNKYIIVINELYKISSFNKGKYILKMSEEKNDNILFIEYNRYKYLFEDLKYLEVEDYKNWLTQDLVI